MNNVLSFIIVVSLLPLQALAIDHQGILNSNSEVKGLASAYVTTPAQNSGGAALALMVFAEELHQRLLAMKLTDEEIQNIFDFLNRQKEQGVSLESAQVKNDQLTASLTSEVIKPAPAPLVNMTAGYQTHLFHFIDQVKDPITTEKLDWIVKNGVGREMLDLSLFKVGLCLVILENISRSQDKSIFRVQEFEILRALVANLDNVYKRQIQGAYASRMGEANIRETVIGFVHSGLKIYSPLKLQFDAKTTQKFTAEWENQFPQSDHDFYQSYMKPYFDVVANNKSFFYKGVIPVTGMLALFSAFSFYTGNTWGGISFAAPIFTFLIGHYYAIISKSSALQRRANKNYLHKKHGQNFISCLNNLERLKP